MKRSTQRRRELFANLRVIWREPLLFVTIIAIFYFLLTFVAFPIFQVFRTSLTADGDFSLSNYAAVFKARYYFQPFLNSMVLGLLTATIGTFVGYVFAYGITRTPLPAKRFFRLSATFPIISPPFVVALSAILLFGRAGTLTPFLERIIGEYSIYGLGGLVLVETIAYAPTA